MHFKNKKFIIILGVLISALLLYYLFTLSDAYSRTQAKYVFANSSDKIDVNEKKHIFFEAIVPAVNEAYSIFYKDYKKVNKYLTTNTNQTRLKAILKRYKLDLTMERDAILARIKPHPKSIALAQAALESNWGTSRFSREANNLFGIWSFNKKEARIAAKKQRNGNKIYLRRYQNIEKSIEHYYEVMNTSASFKTFREQKLKTNNPLELIKYLDKYSEEKQKYIKSLRQIIITNKLQRFDS